MSYILDALKKSDQERKQGKIPSLQSVHAPQLSAGRKQAENLRKGIVLLGSVCCALLIFVAWQWQTKSKEQAAQPVSAEPAAPADERHERLASPAPGRDQVVIPRQSEQEAVPQAETGAETAIPPIPEDQISIPGSRPEAVNGTGLSEPRDEIRPAQPPPQVVDRETALPLLRDLPVEQQQAIPKLTLAGHVYADEPSRRMIMINNRIVREGEPIGERLRLVRITWDGVVIRHVDTEFQIKLQ